MTSYSGNGMKLGHVTLDDIARVAKVHKMTVSRALRNQSSISAATRRKIQRIARKLGYRPNPLVSIYQSHIRSGRALNYQATLGWINDYADSNYWHFAPWTRGLFEGARDRARELGFGLDEIWLDKVDPNDPDANIARYGRVLRARGIHGIILPLSALYAHAFRLWPGVSVAVIGLHHGIARRHTPVLSVSPTVYHTASFDYFNNMRLACERLRDLGYRRIGLIISPWLDAHSDHLYRGSFLAQQLDWPRPERIPILFDDNNETEPSAELKRWLNRYNPDCVICSTNLAKGWIEKLGRQVPGEIGLAHLYLAEDVKGWSGIDPNMREVGAAAVDLVVQQLRLNERGFPVNCHELFITGRWVDGGTVRKVAAA